MRKKFINEPLVTTCVRVPADIWKKCKEEKISFAQVFMRGWLVMNGEPQIVNRQKDLEQEVEKLRRARDIMQQKIYELTSMVKE